jgi:hypothetical protein
MFTELLLETNKIKRISRFSAVPPAMILRRSFSTRETSSGWKMKNEKIW